MIEIKLMLHQAALFAGLPLAAFVFVLFMIPRYAKMLEKSGEVVVDVNKKIHTMIPRPVSLPLFIGFMAGEVLLYVVFQNIAVNMIIAVAMIAFVVGYIDDKKTQRGWFKPLALVAAGIPILYFGTYHNSLVFPIIGLVEIPPLFYRVIMGAMIPVIGNTVNSIDVVNGAVTGVMTIASVALSLILMINGDMELSIITMVLTCVSFAAYYYHKYPSKIFLGDSGTLMLGAIFMGIAIAGNVEVFAVIILAPLILNSALYIISSRGIKEHRELENPPIIHDENMRLCNSGLKGAPWTLVRLLVWEEPQTEKQISYTIMFLVFCTSLMAVGLAMLT